MHGFHSEFTGFTVIPSLNETDCVSLNITGTEKWEKKSFICRYGGRYDASSHLKWLIKIQRITLRNLFRHTI